MNGNPFKPVASGDRFKPTRDWINATTRAVQAHRQGRGGTDVDPRVTNTNEGLLLVKNTSGANIAQGQVLADSGVIFGPTDNLNEFLFNFALNGKAVTAADTGRFFVAFGPIAQGAIGYCYVFGVCPVRVKVNSSTDLFADVAAGQQYLQTAATGPAQMLYLAASEGLTPDVRWALIRFPAGGGTAGASLSYAKLTADWTGTSNLVAGSKCDVSGTLLVPTVSVQITLFQYGGAAYSDLKSGNVIAYLPTTVKGTDGIIAGAQPLPTATAKYQVLQTIAAGNGPLVFDWVRAH